MKRLFRSGREKPDALYNMTEIKMIVGLGNPGKEYAQTRHNAGFEAVDYLADSLGIDVRKKKFGALIGQGRVGEKKIVFLKPLQYMNRSGQVIATASGFYRITAADILVITDDMALEPGRIRIRPRGSSGGHNGLSDIIAKLGTDEFARLRIGIGKPDRQISRDYVLTRPSADDRQLIEKAVKMSSEAVICWLNEGIDKAMTVYNTKMANNNN